MSPTRRAVLSAALVGAGGLLAAGCDPGSTPEALRPTPRPRPTAVPVESLPRVDTLAGVPLIYEVTGTASPFPLQGALAERLDACLLEHSARAGWDEVAAISSLGTWRPTPEGQDTTSWHQEGRAFDLARVVAADGGDLVSCRYDQWGALARDDPVRRRLEREYWRLAASLHRDFAYVLTHLYDAAHHDHIHLDDGLSGTGRSEFRRGSPVQVHAVQAMLRHVWGREVEVTGEFDRTTRRQVQEVLDSVDIPGRLTDARTWHHFLQATADGGTA